MRRIVFGGSSLSHDDQQSVLDALDASEVVLAPTDTVYGLLARADDPTALARVYGLKQRPTSLPMAVFSRWDFIDNLVDVDTPCLKVRGWKDFMTTLGACSLTLVLPPLPDLVLPEPYFQRGRPVGIRPTVTPLLQQLCRTSPLTATSANRHRGNPARSMMGVDVMITNGCTFVLDGGPTPRGRPSVAVDLCGSAPRIIRSGEDEAAVLAFFAKSDTAPAPQ